MTVYRVRAAVARGRARAAFEIECSSGTYVRQLVADLGDAYCEELERTAIGPFQLADADPERIVAPQRRARVPAERPLDAARRRRVRNGIRVAAPDGDDGRRCA